MLIRVSGSIVRHRSEGWKTPVRGLAALGLLVALAFAAAGAWRASRLLAAQAPSAPRHALVISVDGLGAQFYMAPPAGARIPNLLRLKNEGSFAAAVTGVYPSVTYPSHTTLVTGRTPAEHGIYTNLSSRQAVKNPHDWFWFAKTIKVPTLWDEAKRAGVSTAAVSWPVTVGAALDWNVPEYWDPAKESFDIEFIAPHATPGLMKEIAAALAPLPPASEEDAIRTKMMEYIIKKYKPRLMLIHLVDLDGAQHANGPASAEAVRTLERIDAQVGELLAAVRDAGIENTTDVFIVSDHGFLPVEREVRPNVLLARAGLLEVNSQGAIAGGKIATVASGGSFFVYWPEGQDFRREVDAALQPLREQGVLWAVLGPEALAEVGAEPAARLALEAPSGVGFSGGATGQVVTRKKSPGGTHGYLPFRHAMASSFIAWGPRIRSGVNLHGIRMTAIAPTILKDLGIDNPRFGDHPPLVEIFK